MWKIAPTAPGALTFLTRTLWERDCVWRAWLEGMGLRRSTVLSSVAERARR